VGKQWRLTMCHRSIFSAAIIFYKVCPTLGVGLFFLSSISIFVDVVFLEYGRGDD
jgi:hypothetical protein